MPTLPTFTLAETFGALEKFILQIALLPKSCIHADFKELVSSRRFPTFASETQATHDNHDNGTGLLPATQGKKVRMQSCLGARFLIGIRAFSCRDSWQQLCRQGRAHGAPGYVQQSLARRIPSLPLLIPGPVLEPSLYSTSRPGWSSWNFHKPPHQSTQIPRSPSQSPKVLLQNLLPATFRTKSSFQQASSDTLSIT